MRNNVIYIKPKSKGDDLLSPAQRILLEAAQKEIDKLRSTIQQLKKELEEKNQVCKCCLSEIIEESIIDGICQMCFEEADPHMLQARIVRKYND